MAGEDASQLRPRYERQHEVAERLQERERGQLGAIDAATATKQSVEQRISTLLPAEKATAEAELAEA